MKRTLAALSFCALFSMSGSLEANTVYTVLGTGIDSAITAGSVSLHGFDLNISTTGGGGTFSLVSDSDQTSDNDNLNTFLNDSTSDITFGRFRFLNTDGTAVLTFTQTGNSNGSNVSLLAGLVDLDHTTSTGSPHDDTAIITSNGNPFPASHILGAWEYKTSDGTANYVYTGINHDSGTGLMSPPSGNPGDTNPEPIILLDVTNLPDFSVQIDADKGSQVALFVVDGLTPLPPVPEPTTVALLGFAGVCGVTFLRRRTARR